ncbi:phosphoadenosine phosphosulfate reductase family protein [Rhodocytophaga aerolata]|uniref:Phosphoadenosine phosphosulfate reductase family protein n=1 Tax=Rhodocytophaga aerolata TaxID=455078 RepID=A0ABT8RE70_9BACT|nr:phosphoadenosine phosphosulfate reductase family protein [Rhodocytophaga aerolata]MDO1449528.1 phosphoadenosine phosphosulfate reductase family protein [Rhodocytophaga aerolata]
MAKTTIQKATESRAKIEKLTGKAKRPAKVLRPEIDLKRSNDQLNLFDVDKLIEEIDSIRPKDKAQRIIDEADFSSKRDMIKNWLIEEHVKILIAFSGGKDSIAMALFLAFELGLGTERIELWHHEIDGHGELLFDWACTTSYCQAFADHFGFKLLFSYRKGGIVREMYRTNETSQSIFFQQEPGGEYSEVECQQQPKFFSTRRKFPAKHKDIQVRWCSGKVKIDVMAKAITNSDRFYNCQLMICTGERRLESDKRAEYDEIKPYNGMTRTRRALVWRPIIDWTDKEVWAIMEKYKVQPHPCYVLGWSRCSCQCCIFNDQDTFATIAEISPQKIKRLVEIEKDFDFTMFNEYSVAAHAALGNSFLRKNFEGDDRNLVYWVNQAIDEFTAPIIVENWVLPAGASNMKESGAS